MNSGKLWTSVHDVNQLQMHKVIVRYCSSNAADLGSHFAKEGLKKHFKTVRVVNEQLQSPTTVSTFNCHFINFIALLGR